MVDMQRPTNASTALGRRYPEQIVIAAARDLKGIYNPITLGWTMLASHEPAMIAIAVGKSRYSHDNIKRARQFTITFPAADMTKEILFYGTQSGSTVEKLKQMNEPVQKCKKIDSVIFTRAAANFECVLAGELEAGDHTIFVGRIEQAWTNNEKKQRIYTLGAGYDTGTVAGTTVMKYDTMMFRK